MLNNNRPGRNFSTFSTAWAPNMSKAKTCGLIQAQWYWCSTTPLNGCFLKITKNSLEHLMIWTWCQLRLAISEIRIMSQFIRQPNVLVHRKKEHIWVYVVVFSKTKSYTITEHLPAFFEASSQEPCQKTTHFSTFKYILDMAPSQ